MASALRGRRDHSYSIAATSYAVIYVDQPSERKDLRVQYLTSEVNEGQCFLVLQLQGLEREAKPV